LNWLDATVMFAIAMPMILALILILTGE